MPGNFMFPVIKIWSIHPGMCHLFQGYCNLVFLCLTLLGVDFWSLLNVLLTRIFACKLYYFEILQQQSFILKFGIGYMFPLIFILLRNVVCITF